MEKDKLIEEVTSYVDKVFFYFIKRVKIRSDAEDLTQDTLLDVITKINQGIKIDNLDYYIFGVCKNKYNSYLRHLYKRRENEEYSEVEIKEDTNTMLDKLIEDEKIMAMNKAIKLLSKDFAEILFAYYIEDKTIKSISKDLNLPLGSVGRKLSEIRNKLKEYLKMERLNGKKAYVPLELTFTTSGNNFRTNPHNGVRNLLSQNILIHSYDNPCSIDDYAIELGVSRPYIENFVNNLVNTYLLKQVDNKYITDFLIITKSTQTKIINSQLKYISKISETMLKLLSNHENEYSQILFVASDLPYNKKLWSLSLHILDNIFDDLSHFKYTVHSDGSEWNFLGEEKLTNRYNNLYYVGNSGYGDQNGFLNVWAIGKEKIWDNLITFDEINEYKSEFGYIISNAKKSVTKLSKNLHIKKALDFLMKNNMVNINNDKINFNFLVFDKNEYDKFTNLSKEFDEYQEIVKIINESIEEIYQILKEDTPSYLVEQLGFCVENYLCNYRSACIDYLLEHDKLYYNSDEVFPYNVTFIMK